MLLSAAYLLTTLTLATESGLRLHWDAPSSCPLRAHVIRAIRAQLTEHAERNGVVFDVSIRVQIVARGFVADVDLRAPGVSVRRTFPSDDCDDLVAIAALLVAVNIDPPSMHRALVKQRTRSEPVSEPPAPAVKLPAQVRVRGPNSVPVQTAATRTPSPSRPAHTEPARTEPARTEEHSVANDGATQDTTSARSVAGAAPVAAGVTRPGRPTPFRGALRWTIDLGWGLLPRTAVGVHGRAALRQTWWRVEVGAGWWPEHTVYRDDGQGGVAIRLLQLSARWCFAPTWNKLTIPLCAGTDAGWMQGEGRGVDHSRTAVRGWSAASIGPGLLWQAVPRVALYAGAEGRYAWLTPSF